MLLLRWYGSMKEVEMGAKMQTGSWTQLLSRQNLPFVPPSFLSLIKDSLYLASAATILDSYLISNEDLNLTRTAVA
jgi:hypothetical protein